MFSIIMHPSSSTLSKLNRLSFHFFEGWQVITKHFPLISTIWVTTEPVFQGWLSSSKDGMTKSPPNFDKLSSWSPNTAGQSATSWVTPFLKANYMYNHIIICYNCYSNNWALGLCDTVSWGSICGFVNFLISSRRQLGIAN